MSPTNPFRYRHSLRAGGKPILGYGILTFTGGAADQNDSWVRFDDYLVTAVPKPSTWAAMLGIAAMVTVVMRRRIRR